MVLMDNCNVDFKSKYFFEHEYFQMPVKDPKTMHNYPWTSSTTNIKYHEHQVPRTSSTYVISVYAVGWKPQGEGCLVWAAVWVQSHRLLGAQAALYLFHVLHKHPGEKENSENMGKWEIEANVLESEFSNHSILSLAFTETLSLSHVMLNIAELLWHLITM